MRRRTSRKADALQLELFENDLRSYTDRELWGELTEKADQVSDYWEGGYRLESLFNHLTPHRRRIAAAAVELYRRREVRQRERIQLASSVDVYQLMRPMMGDLPIEEVWLIGLNSRYREIGKKRLSIGGLNQAMVDVRIVARQAIEWQATSCILVHNHPSGSTRPSKMDKQLTTAVSAALRTLNIILSDHIIVTAEGYYSFNDEGEL